MGNFKQKPKHSQLTMKIFNLALLSAAATAIHLREDGAPADDGSAPADQWDGAATGENWEDKDFNKEGPRDGYFSGDNKEGSGDEEDKRSCRCDSGSEKRGPPSGGEEQEDELELELELAQREGSGPSDVEEGSGSEDKEGSGDESEKSCSCRSRRSRSDKSEDDEDKSGDDEDKSGDDVDEDEDKDEEEELELAQRRGPRQSGDDEDKSGDEEDPEDDKDEDDKDEELELAQRRGPRPSGDDEDKSGDDEDKSGDDEDKSGDEEGPEDDKDEDDKDDEGCADREKEHHSFGDTCFWLHENVDFENTPEDTWWSQIEGREETAEWTEETAWVLGSYCVWAAADFIEEGGEDEEGPDAPQWDGPADGEDHKGEEWPAEEGDKNWTPATEAAE